MSQIISKIKYDLSVVSFLLCFVRHPVFPWYFIHFIKLSIYPPVLTRNPYTALAPLNQGRKPKRITNWENWVLESNFFFFVFTFILYSFFLFVFSILSILLTFCLCSALPLLSYFLFSLLNLFHHFLLSFFTSVFFSLL